MSQWSAITSPSTYNGRSHHTPEYCNIENQRRSRDDLPVSTVTTTFLPSERSAPISVCVYTYSSSNLEEAHWQKHFAANIGYITRATNTYEGEIVYDWSTLTATNICTSKVHLRRWHPTIEGHWRWEAFPRLRQTYSGDTLRSMKCIYGYRPEQFRRPTMTTTTTMMTMTTSEHKYYGQSNRQSANQAQTILWHSASKNYWRRRH